ncbi:conserved hypothetical protein [Ricinus communis]|uniref:Transcription factor MYC/MYB N-terminal domain-containing protein n=1 Tax=Ricinus communis TaxID=3988 RepID=B9T4B2_RICCO|nr:conserved hypothetical protein [Ricinus communis]
MVGSGGADRSKEAVGMMALHEALRSVCLNTDWTYSVFWTIRPRPRVRGGNGCKVGDDNGSFFLQSGLINLSLVFRSVPVQPIILFLTIAVIQAGHGLLQLGSCKIIPEDLHFVLRMRHTFESLGYQSGFYLSQLFSSTRNTSSSSSIPSKQSAIPTRPPPALFNWGQRPLPSAASMLASPNFPGARLGFPQAKDEPHMFILPHAAENRMEEMMGEHENDIKWPNGLSFFNALTGRTDDAKLLFNPESLGNKADQNHHPIILEGKNPNANPDPSNMHNAGGANPNEFLSLDSHPDSARKMENKFKRSFTLPARMATSSSSTSVDHHQQQPVELRNSEAGMYSDVMETFLD